MTSQRNAVYFAGKFINGLGIGVLVPVCMTYIGELAPQALRGILSAAAPIALTLGPFTQSLITNKYGTLPKDWAYKSLFVAQYGVTGIGLLLWPFMPESPTWHITKGQDDQAIRCFKRLGEKGDEETEGGTWAECFRKSNLRRSMVAVAPLSIQAWTGVFWIRGYATYYYQLAGFDTQASYHLAIIQQVLSAVGNITSWFLIDRFGRRGLSFWGLVILTINLFLAGGFATGGTTALNKAASAMIILYCCLYNATIGATGYVAMAEIATSRLRQKTASITLLVQGLSTTMWSFVLPYIFNPNQGNLQGKTAFVYCGFSILCCVYFFFCHPETKHRSYEELDELFRKNIPARQFASYVTEAQTRSQEAQQEYAEGRRHL